MVSSELAEYFCTKSHKIETVLCLLVWRCKQQPFVTSLVAAARVKVFWTFRTMTSRLNVNNVNRLVAVGNWRPYRILPLIYLLCNRFVSISRLLTLNIHDAMSATHISDSTSCTCHCVNPQLLRTGRPTDRSTNRLRQTDRQTVPLHFCRCYNKLK